MGEHTYAGGMYDQSLEFTSCIVNDITIVNVIIKVLSCGMMMFKQPLLYQTYFVQLVTMSVYCCVIAIGILIKYCHLFTSSLYSLSLMAAAAHISKQ